MEHGAEDQGGVPDLGIRNFGPADRAWADALLAKHQASSRTVRLGELFNPLEEAGLVAERNGNPLGLLTYRLRGDELEILSLHSAEPGQGAGTALLRAAEDAARGLKCRRMVVFTTNDNMGALTLYQRWGLRLRALHVGAVDSDRLLKPEIPTVNAATGLPIRDLLELSKPLA